MFVVQRSFRTVRRGYDRDEVDRHLELVSQWFTSTDVGRAFTHQRSELEERERALAAREADQARLVEGARLEADATLEGARRRADAAAEAAERTRADARAEAQTIRAGAERDRAEMLDRARVEAAAAEVVRVAEERAAKMLRDASEGARDDARRGARRRRARGDGQSARRASNTWPMRAPRRRSWPSGCARMPSRSCRPTASAAAARLTGSQQRRAGSTGHRRRNAQWARKRLSHRQRSRRKRGTETTHDDPRCLALMPMCGSSGSFSLNDFVARRVFPAVSVALTRTVSRPLRSRRRALRALAVSLTTMDARPAA